MLKYGSSWESLKIMSEDQFSVHLHGSAVRVEGGSGCKVYSFDCVNVMMSNDLDASESLTYDGYLK